MTGRIFRNFAQVMGYLLLGSLSSSIQGQCAYFSRPTDTISIAGDTTLGSAATYEAVVQVNNTGNNNSSNALQGGSIFNEWQYGLEDKHLEATTTSIFAYAFPINVDNGFVVQANLTGGFHDIAYVYDGAQERIYLDGQLLASRGSSPNSYSDGNSIRNSATSIGSIGAIFRDGGLTTSFLGYIDTLRVSDIARYSGNSYVPIYGDLTSDSETQLLYNFDEPAGSTTIPDLSGHGHTGTLGVGFQGATAPTLGVSLPSGSPVPEPGTYAYLGSVGLMGTALLLRLRRS